jgi:phospholipid/cholesterol/gamma-HCH transport system substrate-binding protein
MTLNEQAMVDITIEVAKKYSKWVRKDSTVKLVKEGLVGDSAIEIAVGSLDKPELKAGESIAYLKTKGLDELADEIAEKVTPVLIEVREIIGYINDPDGDLKKTIHNLEVLTRNLEATRNTADTLLVTTSRSLEDISSRTTTLLETAAHKIDSLDMVRVTAALDKLPPLLEKADAAMASVTVISAETKKLAETAFPLIPGVLSRTEELLFSTDRLVNSLNNSWLLGDDSPGASERSFQAGDSHD